MNEHVDFERLLALTDAPMVAITGVPENPDVPVMAASGWDPGSGRMADPVKAVVDFLHEGYAVVVAADGEGSAARLARLFDEHGLELPVVDADSPALLDAGGRGDRRDLLAPEHPEVGVHHLRLGRQV